jgi:TOTE conflict system primase-like protein
MNTALPLRNDLTPDLLDQWQVRFVNRTIPYGLQQADGSYPWVYEPCTLDLLAAHLRGEVTLALSSSDARGACRWLCLDVDAPGMVPQLVTLCGALADLGLPGLVEASRRSGHLWLFFDAPLPAVAARFAIATALEAVSAVGVEVPTNERYPDLVGPGAIGHSVRLPLGIHRKTGVRYPFFDEEGLPCAFTSLARAVAFVLATPLISARWAEAQWNAYRADRRAAGVGGARRAQANSQGAAARGRAKESASVSQGIGTRSAVIRWVDAEIVPLELLVELAPECELKRQGKGYLGWCPFHDDRAADADGCPGSPSFYVIKDRRYGWSWRCLSTNCAFSLGPMKHSFRLLQELLELSVAATIHEARQRWPECAPLSRGDEGMLLDGRE